MDTRPYRMGFSRYTHTVFEVDSDVAILDAKHAALEHAGFRPRCAVKCASADIGSASSVQRALEQAGFDPRLPTRWVAEGLLEYLAADSHAPLFAMASDFGGTAGSGFAAQVLEPSFGAHVASLDLPLPYQPLRPAEAVLEEMGAAGWRNRRVMRQPELQEAAAGRVTHEGFTLAFADADTLEID